MKKNIIIFKSIFVILGIFFITACAGASDWSYNLPGNYKIILFNAHDVRIIKTGDTNYYDSEKDLKNDDYVKEFCCNERYIFLKCIKRSIIESYSNIAMSSILEQIKDDQIDYYIIDIKNDIISNSFSKEEFEKNIRELDLDDMSEWLNTYDTPEGATFD